MKPSPLTEGEPIKTRRVSDSSPHAAAILVTAKVPTAPLGAHIGDVEKILLRDVKKLDTIHYVYVVDEKGRLKGVLSIKELFLQKKNARVDRVMMRRPLSVRPSAHRERVAYLALQNHIKEMPVTDERGLFLGVVPGDALFQTLYRETTKDLLQMSGHHASSKIVDNIFELSTWQLFRHRFPWLFLGLVGGILTAKIISGFSAILEENLLLATFIPLMVYIADAVGTQMEAFIIRDMAMNPRLKFLRYFGKQFTVISWIGLVCAILLYGFTLWVSEDSLLALTLALSMLAGILSSVVTGLLIPFLLSKVRIDPANASGPMATILQDMLSVLIYFSVAEMLL